MSKFSDALNKLRIFNNHELLSRFGERGRDIVVEYYRPAEGRAGWGSIRGSRAWSPSHSVDPSNTRQLANFPGKNFWGNRAESFPKAIAWVEGKYKVKLVASPFGGRVPDYVVEAAKKAASEAQR